MKASPDFQCNFSFPRISVALEKTALRCQRKSQVGFILFITHLNGLQTLPKMYFVSLLRTVIDKPTTCVTYSDMCDSFQREGSLRITVGDRRFAIKMRTPNQFTFMRGYFAVMLFIPIMGAINIQLSDKSLARSPHQLIYRNNAMGL